MNLLPPDTVIISGKRKRSLTPKAREREKHKSTKKERIVEKGSSQLDGKKRYQSERQNDDDNDEEEPDDSDDQSEDGPPPEPMDPENSLESLPKPKLCLPTTVHWDPTDADGRKIGWKVKIAYTDKDWVDGRIVRYDPHTHKHKIEFEPTDEGSGRTYIWIWLRNEQHNLQLATRMVWAHVKGYAWWPALVMESNSPSADSRKEGYVLLEFFGTGEISTLRDTEESVRPFSPDRVDPVVAKHKKKRNAKAYAKACEEFVTIRRTRNEAALYYARSGIKMVMKNPEQQIKGKNLIGKTVEIFRSDVNYPYGDTVTGKVHQYSYNQKKWLLSFEMSSRTKMKYDSAWMNLQTKETAVRILDKKKPETISDEDLLPYLFGWESFTKLEKLEDESSLKKTIYDGMLKERCRACLEIWKPNDAQVTCQVCDGSYHLNCVDSPLSPEAWQRITRDGTPFVCPRCKPCRGCYRNDIVYGCHPHPCPPPTLSFPNGESLDLCSMCREAFDDERFCPNCAHSWDDKKFRIIRKQMEHYEPSFGRKRKCLKPTDIEDSVSELLFGSFSGDEVLPLGAKVNASYFYPETTEWGL